MQRYTAARDAYHAEINALGYAPVSPLYKAFAAAREAYDLELHAIEKAGQ